MGILLHETAVAKVHNWGLLPVQRWWRHPTYKCRKWATI